ncbi:hypothetical protein EVAR_18950_1 [Eumeta japonica]|uniref:Uncharacterized protein n=1 Tax=Eumeta variegata TaxID=151549 RepID=A0A4C1V3J5_EUMVA|nr:hypothetical protein EVAR_18950_1 [Eumeta japonica]
MNPVYKLLTGNSKNDPAPTSGRTERASLSGAHHRKVHNKKATTERNNRRNAPRGGRNPTRYFKHKRRATVCYPASAAVDTLRYNDDTRRQARHCPTLPDTMFTPTTFRPTKSPTRGRPIIVEWETRHLAKALSFGDSSLRYRALHFFISDSQPQPNLRRCQKKEYLSLIIVEVPNISATLNHKNAAQQSPRAVSRLRHSPRAESARGECKGDVKPIGSFTCGRFSSGIGYLSQYARRPY